jgi:hypothetical protein
MGYEFLIKSLDNKKTLDLGVKYDINYENKDFLVRFLKNDDNGKLIFGFKFKCIENHNWDWDGYLFIGVNSGLIQYNTGDVIHVESFNFFIKNKFKEAGIDILIEEDW